MNLERDLLGHFVTNHPEEAARMIHAMPIAEAVSVVSDLSAQEASVLVRGLPSVMAARVLESLPFDDAVSLLSAANPAAVASALRLTGTERRSALLEGLTTNDRAAVKRLLRYAEGTAGAVMDPQVLSVLGTTTVAGVLAALQAEPECALYYVYVVGEGQRLVGVASLRQVMRAQPNATIASIAEHPVEAVAARSSWETVVSHPAWDRIHALPVIDADDHLVGVIRYPALRELEKRLTGGSAADGGERAALALGEVYALGVRGVFRWALSGEQPPTGTPGKAP